MDIFDSHVHFVDPGRPEGLVWPDENSQIYGRYLPHDLLDSSQPNRLSGCIAVETSRRPQDDDWLIQLAREYELIKGIVLNLQPDTDDFESRLGNAVGSGKFVGIRFRPIADYDLSSTLLLRNIASIQEAQKTIEFGAKSQALKTSFAALAGRFSDVTWVLNHCGHPQTGGMLASDWCDGIAEIAEIPNTICKIPSEYCDPNDWAPVLDFLLGAFGPARLIYGSNWPVCTPSVGPDEASSQLATFLGKHSDDVMEVNAWRVYGLAKD